MLAVVTASRPLRVVPLLLLGAALAPAAHADFFGAGENRFEIPFVTVGQPGNPADTVVPDPMFQSAPLPSGVVNYAYRIGKYEVPEEAVRKANVASAMAGAPLGITLDERGPQKPATSLSWFEAAMFVNWLNADKGHAPAYKFSSAGEFELWQPGDAGYNPSNPFRSTQARYFLPSADEWHKAAFFDPAAGVYWDYPTGSDAPPIPVASGTDPGTAVWNQLEGPADVRLAGGESPYGTVGQAGNVWEREETTGVLTNTAPQELRGVRGEPWGLSTVTVGLSSAFRQYTHPINESRDMGLRIVSVPEPATAVFVSLAALTRPRRRLS